MRLLGHDSFDRVDKPRMGRWRGRVWMLSGELSSLSLSSSRSNTANTAFSFRLSRPFLPQNSICSNSLLGKFDFQGGRWRNAVESLLLWQLETRSVERIKRRGRERGGGVGAGGGKKRRRKEMEKEKKKTSWRNRVIRRCLGL